MVTDENDIFFPFRNCINISRENDLKKCTLTITTITTTAAVDTVSATACLLLQPANISWYHSRLGHVPS